MKITSLILLTVSVQASPIYQNQSGYVEIPLSVKDSLYFMKGVSLGTPGQHIAIQVDTGSSDLVVGSAFKSQDSYSFVDSHEQYNMGYGSTEDFSMNKVYDKINFGAASLQNLTFGLAKLPLLSGAEGILGLGYNTRTAFGPYSTFPVRLVESGLTHRNVYSFFGAETSPSLLFGAVNAAKFTAPLVRFPIVKDVGPTSTRPTYTSLSMAVHSIKVDGVIVSDQTLAYEIDSGANVLATSAQIIANIFAALGKPDYYDDNNLPYYSLERLNVPVSVNFSGYVVEFPIKEICGDFQVVDGTTYATVYLIEVQVGIDTYTGTMPNAILKYYYAVYDLDAGNVYLAPIRHANKPTNSKDIYTITGSSLPVSTTTGSAFGVGYTKMYDESLETVIGSASTAISLKSSTITYTTSVAPSASSIPEISSAAQPQLCYRSR